MSRASLRIYYGPESRSNAGIGGEQVTVPLGEILPLLADAVQSKRTWLKDFTDDEVTISTDLYEIILAYQHCRRPTA